MIILFFPSRGYEMRIQVESNRRKIGYLMKTPDMIENKIRNVLSYYDVENSRDENSGCSPKTKTKKMFAF